MEMNLDDYYVSIEYLDNFFDKSIDNWIASGKSKKITKKLKSVYENGGSFTSNGYQVTSTDAVLSPFLFDNGKEMVIEYAEARHIHFTPSINTSFIQNSIVKTEDTTNKISDDVIVPPPPMETISKKIKRNYSEAITTNPDSTKQPKKKRKLENGTVANDQTKAEQMEASDTAEKKSKSEDNHNGQVDLDSTMIKQENIVASDSEKPKKKKKKSKHKSSVVKVEPVETIFPGADLPIKVEKIEDNKDKHKPKKHKKNKHIKKDLN